MRAKYGRFSSPQGANRGHSHQSAHSHGLKSARKSYRRGYFLRREAGLRALPGDVHLQQQSCTTPRDASGLSPSSASESALCISSTSPTICRTLFFCRWPMKCSRAPSYACPAFFCKAPARGSPRIWAARAYGLARTGGVVHLRRADGVYILRRPARALRREGDVLLSRAPRFQLYPPSSLSLQSASTLPPFFERAARSGKTGVPVAVYYLHGRALIPAGRTAVNVFIPPRRRFPRPRPEAEAPCAPP